VKDGVSSSEFRVRYNETDQMGVAHHAVYLVWCEAARTDYMRQRGVSYRALEEQGLRLPVVAAQLRYRAPARYDDAIRVRCWVRETTKRRVTFGYAIDRPADGRLLATAQTSLIAVDSSHAITVIPGPVRQRLVAVSDPVPLRGPTLAH
jgi:acyl-CoA thioester hydrolase